ncbi:MAG: biopolymer transporter ExbD [Planctomycetia bacterium]|jgi:biopolymer transport protein ExbD
MIPRNTRKRQDEVKLMMAPMIDIVFLLLVFFILTFKIVAPEGDFNVRMPLAAPSPGDPTELQMPPIKVCLTATESGDLAGIYFGDKQPENRVTNFKQLRQKVYGIVGTQTGPGSIAEDAEVELDCAPKLKYRYTIEAITAISGDIKNNQVVKLIEKIKLTPPPAK